MPSLSLLSLRSSPALCDWPTGWSRDLCEQPGLEAQVDHQQPEWNFTRKAPFFFNGEVLNHPKWGVAIILIVGLTSRVFLLLVAWSFCLIDHLRLPSPKEG